jgi:hypothetical protein
MNIESQIQAEQGKQGRLRRQARSSRLLPNRSLDKTLGDKARKGMAISEGGVKPLGSE